MTQHDPDELFAQTALSGLPPVEPSAGLARRVAQLPLTHPRREHSRFWPFRTVWLPALGWGLAAALGVVAGMNSNLGLDDTSLSVGATSALVEGQEPLSKVVGGDDASTSDASTSDASTTAEDEQGLDALLTVAWGSDQLESVLVDDLSVPEAPRP